jgi:hypothetical protein
MSKFISWLSAFSRACLGGPAFLLSAAFSNPLSMELRQAPLWLREIAAFLLKA